MTTKLHLYGALARALYYQQFRRNMEHKAELQSLGFVSRWFPDVYDWWRA